MTQEDFTLQSFTNEGLRAIEDDEHYTVSLRIFVFVTWVGDGPTFYAVTHCLVGMPSRHALQ